MRILLDECIPRKAKQCFSGHDVFTAPEMGWAGYTNGKLLNAIKDRFDFFVTVDRNLQFQQNVDNLPFGVIVLTSKSNKFSDLEPLLLKIPDLLLETNLGKITAIS